MSKTQKPIKKYLTAVIDFLVPLLESLRANKKILSRMPSIESGEKIKYMASYESLTLQVAEDFHKNSTEQMKSLEDKARISLMGITIVISIITGLAASFFSLGNGQFHIVMKILIVLLSAMSVVYMSMAGWAALKVLGDLNKVDELSPEASILPEKEKLKKIAVCTELNINRNLMRNNLIYVSYRNILYAIVLLSLAFILIGVANVVIPMANAG